MSFLNSNVTRISRSRPLVRASLTLVSVALVAAACAQRPEIVGGAMPRVDARPIDGRAASDPLAFYHGAGFLTSTGEIPFVGAVRYLATKRADSAYAIIAVSFANQSLTFARDGETYHGGYDVVLEVKQAGRVVRRVATREEVRVATFRETTRPEESVIFQQVLTVPRGELTLELSIADAGSTRRGRVVERLNVPSFQDGTLGWPIVTYGETPRLNLETRPTTVQNPRATVSFMRDSVLEVYLEAYGRDTPTMLRLIVQGPEGTTILEDTVPLIDRGELSTGDAKLRLTRLGVGPLVLIASYPDGSQAIRVPAVVALADGLLATSFEELLEYLRYFVSADRLRALRTADPAQRARAWASLLRDTDPNPLTPNNEALSEYIERLSTANVRFREDGTAGWMTARGAVYTALGPPDNVIEPNTVDPQRRDRTQVWEYLRHRTRLVFVDANGQDRWRLTVNSETDFQSLLRRLYP